MSKKQSNKSVAATVSPKNLGICVMLPGIMFIVDVPKADLAADFVEAVQNLDKLGVNADPVNRISCLMSYSCGLVDEFISMEHDEEKAIGEIAYSFIYAYMLGNQSASLEDAAGMMATLDNDEVTFKIFMDREKFDSEGADLKELMQSVDDDGEDDEDDRGGLASKQVKQVRVVDVDAPSLPNSPDTLSYIKNGVTYH